MQHKEGGSDQDKGRLKQEAAEHRKLERRTHNATVASGVTAGAALLLSIGSLVYTAVEADRRDAKETEAAAVQQSRSYLELVLQHPEIFQLDLKNSDVPGSFVLATAEAVYHLTERDEGWNASLKWMLDRHGNLLMQRSWDCGSFSERFVRFVKQQKLGDAGLNLRCDPGTDPTEPKKK